MVVTVSSIGVFGCAPCEKKYCLAEGVSFSDLIKKMVPDYPKCEKIFYSSQINDIVILLNGKSILLEGGFSAQLKDGDDIFIAPMTYGG